MKQIRNEMGHLADSTVPAIQTTIEISQDKPSAPDGIKFLNLDELEPDPNQPRQTYDQQSMAELTESVRENDVLQSILVRPFPQQGYPNKQASDPAGQKAKYRIVFGHRRYKAALTVQAEDATRNKIAAIIRELTDAQALALQLLENIQREDVHPLEQAAGFKRLLDERLASIQDISTEMGKPVTFIRQQIRLNDLSDQWKMIFRKGGIKLIIALQLSELCTEAQEELFETHVTAYDLKSDHPSISLNAHTIARYKGMLSKACFDLSDTTLDPKMGACITCPFNSACGSLFPEQEREPRCNNVICFNRKTEAYTQKELAKAKEDVSTVLIYDDYDTTEAIEELKKEGHELLRRGYDKDCREIDAPEAPIWEDFYNKKKYPKRTKKEAQEAFDAALHSYVADKETFDAAVAAGRYKKAFIVHDNRRGTAGKYTYIELNKKEPGKKVKQVITAGNADADAIKDEITRITDREKRQKELDREKVHKRIVEAVEKDKTSQLLPKTASKTDDVLICFLLLDQFGHSKKEMLQKAIKSTVLWKELSTPEQYFSALSKLSKVQVSFIVRQLIHLKYSTSLPQYKSGMAYRIMAESIGTIPIKQFETEQAAIAKKRINRVETEINRLKGLQQELKKEAGKTKKITKPEPTKKAA